MTILEQFAAQVAKDAISAEKLAAMRAALPEGITLENRNGSYSLVSGTTKMQVNIVVLAAELL